MREDILPDGERGLAVAGSRKRDAVEEGRGRIAGRKLGRPAVRELGRLSQSVSVIGKRMAEADPQLRISRIAPDGVLKDAAGIEAIASTGERFGHQQPALCPGEVP